jgi:hypothetical protein
MPNTRIAANAIVVNLTGTDSRIPASTISALGNITGGNLLTSNAVIATGNIQAGNLRTTGSISATGAITGSTANITGTITGGNLAVGSGFVSAGNIISAGPISAQSITANTLTVSNFNLANVSTAGNVTGGNILTSGNMSATGNVRAGANVSALNFNTINANGIIQGGSLSVFGNIAGGNISIAGSVRAATFLNTNGTPYQSPGGPAFIARVTNQSIPASPSTVSLLPLIFTSVTQNINSGYNPSTGIFTAPVAGFYQVSATVGVSAPFVPPPPAAGALILYQSGIAVQAGPYIEAITVGGTTVINSSSVSRLVYLNVGETLRCVLAYIGGSGWSTNTNLIPGSFQACWLRP